MNKMTSLKVNNLVEDGMLRTVMLSIFDFWDQSSFDFSEKTREFSQKEFSGHIINSLANPNAELLFCGVATRKMVHDLSLQVHEKLDRIDETLRMEMAWLHSVFPAKEDQLRPAAKHEAEPARAAPCASRPRSHNQKEPPQQNSRCRQDNHTPSTEQQKHKMLVRGSIGDCPKSTSELSSGVAANLTESDLLSMQETTLLVFDSKPTEWKSLSSSSGTQSNNGGTASGQRSEHRPNGSIRDVQVAGSSERHGQASHLAAKSLGKESQQETPYRVPGHQYHSSQEANLNVGSAARPAHRSVGDKVAMDIENFGPWPKTWASPFK